MKIVQITFGVDGQLYALADDGRIFAGSFTGDRISKFDWRVVNLPNQE